MDTAIPVGIALGYAFVVSCVLALILDRAIGLRVAEDEERQGLDLTQHNEQAWMLAE